MGYNFNMYSKTTNGVTVTVTPLVVLEYIAFIIPHKRDIENNFDCLK